MDPLALNYIEPMGNPLVDVNTDNATCIYEILGCMDPLAFNYNPLAMIDDGSCFREGCMSAWADNYDSLATVNNNSCTIQFNEQEYEGILTDNSLISSLQEQIDNLSSIETQYNVVLNAYSILQEQLEQCEPDAYGQITLELKEGWNMIGYNLISPSNVADKISDIASDVELVKDNNGKFYWPGFGYNSIGNFTPGHGYFIKMNTNRDFIFKP